MGLKKNTFWISWVINAFFIWSYNFSNYNEDVNLYMFDIYLKKK